MKSYIALFYDKKANYYFDTITSFGLPKNLQAFKERLKEIEGCKHTSLAAILSVEGQKIKVIQNIIPVNIFISVINPIGNDYEVEGRTDDTLKEARDTLHDNIGDLFEYQYTIRVYKNYAHCLDIRDDELRECEKRARELWEEREYERMLQECSDYGVVLPMREYARKEFSSIINN